MDTHHDSHHDSFSGDFTNSFSNRYSNGFSNNFSDTYSNNYSNENALTPTTTNSSAKYKKPIPRRMSRKQSDAEAPQVQMVSVAVLPPRLPPGMAPPSGVGPAMAFSWDEAVNYQHNDNVDQPEPGKTKSFLRKAGLTTQRTRKNPDLPPFQFRQVPYDTWRKHYAKDAEGNYRGTHAPAMDCLLKPEDVAKWRFEEPKTKADQWTRGAEVLPVYAEVAGEERTPDYNPVHYDGVPPGEPVLNSSEISTGSSLEPPRKDVRQGSTGKEIADGKTAQQIIEEAKNKPKPTQKQTWKQMLKKGGEMAMMGN